MSVDWKALANLDPESVKDDPHTYVRAIALKKDWGKLLELSRDAFYADYVARILKVPFVYKTVFTGLSCSRVVEILDCANEKLRKVVFSLLLKFYDTMPIAGEVGAFLMQNTSKYPWAIRYPTFLIALQPEEDLLKAMGASGHGTGNLSPLDVWRDIHEGKATSHGFHVNYLPPVSKLKGRRGIASAVCKNFVKQLEVPDRIHHAFQFLSAYKCLWSLDKELYDMVKSAVRSHFWKFTPGDVHAMQAATYGFHIFNGMFAFFMNLGIMDEEFFTDNFVRSFESEAEKPVLMQELMGAFVTLEKTRIFSETDRYGKFFMAMHTLARLPEIPSDKPLECALAKIWKRMEDARPKIIANQVVSSNTTVFQQIVREFDQGTCQGCMITAAQVKEIIEAVVQEVLAVKEKMAAADPRGYTRLVQSVLNIVTGSNGNLTTTSVITCKAWHLVDESVRNVLITEYVVHPSGRMPLNDELAVKPFTAPLAYVLQLNDIGMIAKILDFGSKSAGENHGFIGKFTVNFPPLPQSDSMKAEAIEGVVHSFERALFKKKVLQHTDLTVATQAISAYARFAILVAKQAIALNDKGLYEHAAAVHRRFLRWVVGKARDDLSKTYLSHFVDVITNPEALCAGYRHSTGLAKQLFDIITNITLPANTAELLEIVKNLLGRTMVHEESEAVAKELAPMVLGHLIARCPQNHGLPTSVQTIQEPRHPTTVNMEQWVSVWDSKIVVCDEKYCSLIIRHTTSKKVTAPLKDVRARLVPHIPSPGPWSTFSWKAMTGVLHFLKIIIDKYLPEKEKFFSTKLIVFIRDLCRAVITAQCENFSPVVPVPENLNKVKATSEQVQAMVSKANFKVQLRRPLWPILRAYAAMSGRNSVVALLDEFSGGAYDAFQDVVRFHPYAMGDTPKLYQEFVSQAKVTFVLHPYTKAYLDEVNSKDASPMDPRAFSPAWRHPVRPSMRGWGPAPKNSLAQTTLPREFASFAYRPLLDIDIDCLRSHVPTGSTFFELAKSVAFLVRFLPAGTDLKVPLHLVKFLLADINKTAAPATAVFSTLFENSSGLVTQKKSQPRGKSKSTRPGMENYRPSKFLLARLFKAFREGGHVGGLDLSIFLDELLELLKLTQGVQLDKLGTDNAFGFADELAMTVLQKVTLNLDLKTAAYLEKPDPPVAVYYGLLSSSVFHHAAVSHLLQLAESIPSVEQRQAVLSLFAVALLNDAIDLTLQARKMLVRMMMTPSIVGPTLPPFVLDILRQLGQNEKLHIDVRRAIFANAVALFSFQASAKMEPDADKIFEVLELVFSKASAAMLPFCCALLGSSVMRILTGLRGFTVLLPKEQQPEEYVAGKVSIEVPCHGAWEAVYEKYLEKFVISGISTPVADSQVLQIVITTLSSLHLTGSRLSEMMAPFLAKGLAKLKPSYPSEALVGFGYQFCFSEGNKNLTEPADELCDALKRLRAFVDEMVGQIGACLVNGDEQGFNSAATACSRYLETFVNPIGRLVERVVSLRGEKESLTWVQTLSRRICDALSVSKESTFAPQGFKSLTGTFSTLASDKFVAVMLTPRDAHIPWSLLLDAARETSESGIFERLLSDNGVVVEDLKCLLEIPPFVMPVTAWNQALKLFRSLEDQELKKELSPKLAEFAAFRNEQKLQAAYGRR